MTAELRIAWSGAGLLAVDKPSGMPSQPDRDRRGDDVETRLRQTHPDARVAHRLDRPASGLLLVVTDPRWHALISQAFRTRTIRRTYRAILAGDAEVGTRWTWTTPLDGRPAHSDALVEGTASGLLAARLTLQTGRTHQLRRHASTAGHPIVGDRRHGAEVGGWAPRLLLHATTLAFEHPATGEAVRVDSALPAPMDDWWTLAGGPAST